MRIRHVSILAVVLAPLAASAQSFPSPQEAAWAGAFVEAGKLLPAASDDATKRAFKHLAEASLLMDKPGVARNSFNKAALTASLREPATYWGCKMYRREGRDREAVDCFKHAGLDEAEGDAHKERAIAAAKGSAGGAVTGSGATGSGASGAGSTAAPAAPKSGITQIGCDTKNGANCSYGGVPVSPDRKEAMDKAMDGDKATTPPPAGASGASGK
ncbi:MAG: hypothetical protein JST92_14880 [Deltaproteobacteria bacterium]|nr:hypothetical protein [Deltaproteobacteria bacterium]